MGASSIFGRALVALAAACLLWACKTQQDPPDPYVPPPAAGFGGAVAGTTPTAGGMGGAAGAPLVVTAGMGGAAGAAPAGAGGMGGAAGAAPAGAGGMGGAAGAAPAGAGGMGGAAGGGDVAMCVTDVMTNNPATDATCAMCMCMGCGTELMAVDGDTNAQAMLSCITMADCSGTCCLCNLPDCMTDLNMFGAGPCGDEIQTAAGVTPMMGLVGAIANGTMVSTNCAPTGPADQSCADAARLGACISMNCATQCPMTACQ